jgi:4'-phosphopantetheinyl transferase
MFSIGPNCIHIWKLYIPEFGEYVSPLEQILNCEELRAASDRATETEKKRCIIVKALVRLLLSEYTGVAPAHVRFAVTTFGKPVLSIAGGEQLRFNITHAGDAAAVAFSTGSEVGVDIEKVRAEAKIIDIIDYTFTEEEKAFLYGADEKKRVDWFFSLWSKKEALIKAVGGSMAIDADRTSVLSTPDNTGWSTAALQNKSTDWYLYEFTPFPGYSGALCTDANRPELLFKRLSLEYFQDMFHNSNHQFF